jgi:hypothetical protein
MTKGNSSPSDQLSIRCSLLSPLLTYPSSTLSSCLKIEDAIAAPISLLHEHSKKVTGGAGTAGSIVKKVLIGKVPDRGGRPLAEHRAKAIIAKEGRGFGRGGGGRDHGGRGRGHGGRGGGDHEKKRKEELGEQSSGSSKKGRTVTLT